MHGAAFNYGRKYHLKQWTDNMGCKKRKGYVIGITRPKIIIDMEIRVGNEKVYSRKGLRQSDADDVIKGLMRKYGCVCK